MAEPGDDDDFTRGGIQWAISENFQGIFIFFACEVMGKLTAAETNQHPCQAGKREGEVMLCQDEKHLWLCMGGGMEKIPHNVHFVKF